MKRIIWIITALSAVIICFLVMAYFKKDQELISDLKILLDKEIILPKYNSDNIVVGDSILEINSADYIIIRYIDSVGCSKCKLQLGAFIDLTNEIKTISEKDIKLVFILNQSSNNYAKSLFDKRSDFIAINDPEDLFCRMNSYPKKDMLNTFLVKNNKIITIGNPVASDKIKNNYYRIILSDRQSLHDKVF